MRPTARSFVLDLLSTLREGSMPVRALIEAGAAFGLAEGAIRVALARLLAARRVERDERGRYRLGEGAEPVRRHVVSWRRLGERVRPWSGGWVAVHTGPLLRARRTTRERALRFLGLRGLEPGLEIRPDNLRGGVEGAREELRALGLEQDAAVFELRTLDAARETRARGLWDVATLEAGYRATLAELERSARRLTDGSELEAMAESFLVGGRAIRQLVLDPLLPEPIATAGARDALVEAVRRYDRIGRGCWSRFLERHGVLPLRAPADTRIAAGASRLAVAEGR